MVMAGRAPHWGATAPLLLLLVVGWAGETVAHASGLACGVGHPSHAAYFSHEEDHVHLAYPRAARGRMLANSTGWQSVHDSAAQTDTLRIGLVTALMDGLDATASPPLACGLATAQVSVPCSASSTATSPCVGGKRLIDCTASDRVEAGNGRHAVILAVSQWAKALLEALVFVRRVAAPGVALTPSARAALGLPANESVNGPVDLIVVLSARPVDGDPIAGSATCVTRDQWGRCVVGHVNLVPGAFSPGAISPLRQISQRQTALHELIHILGGMNPSEVFRNASTGERLPDSQVFKVVARPADAGPAPATLIVTPRVQQLAREHFGCASLEGLPLEDQPLGRGSHWEARTVGPEIMAYGEGTGEAVLSRFTLAFLEDTNQYRIPNTSPVPSRFVAGRATGASLVGMNGMMEFLFPVAQTLEAQLAFDKAIESQDPTMLSWGKEAGCSFPLGKAATAVPASYQCNKSGALTCTSDRRQQAVCALKTNWQLSSSKEVACGRWDATLGDATCTEALNDACDAADCAIPSWLRPFETLKSAQEAAGSVAALPARTGGFSSALDFLPVPVGYWSCLDGASTNTGDNSSTFDSQIQGLVSSLTSADSQRSGGQEHCESCRCFESSLKEFAASLGTTQASDGGMSGMCYRVHCVSATHLQIAVRSSLTGQASWYRCPDQGGELSIAGFTGALRCPPAHEICRNEVKSSAAFPETLPWVEWAVWGGAIGLPTLTVLICLVVPACRHCVSRRLKVCCGVSVFVALAPLDPRDRWIIVKDIVDIGRAQFDVAAGMKGAQARQELAKQLAERSLGIPVASNRRGSTGAVVRKRRASIAEQTMEAIGHITGSAPPRVRRRSAWSQAFMNSSRQVLAAALMVETGDPMHGGGGDRPPKGSGTARPPSPTGSEAPLSKRQLLIQGKTIPPPPAAAASKKGGPKKRKVMPGMFSKPPGASMGASKGASIVPSDAPSEPLIGREASRASDATPRAVDVLLPTHKKLVEDSKRVDVAPDMSAVFHKRRDSAGVVGRERSTGQEKRRVSQPQTPGERDRSVGTGGSAKGWVLLRKGLMNAAREEATTRVAVGGGEKRRASMIGRRRRFSALSILGGARGPDVGEEDEAMLSKRRVRELERMFGEAPPPRSRSKSKKKASAAASGSRWKCPCRKGDKAARQHAMLVINPQASWCVCGVGLFQILIAAGAAVVAALLGTSGSLTSLPVLLLAGWSLGLGVLGLCASRSRGEIASCVAILFFYGSIVTIGAIAIAIVWITLLQPSFTSWSVRNWGSIVSLLPASILPTPSSVANATITTEELTAKLFAQTVQEQWWIPTVVVGSVVLVLVLGVSALSVLVSCHTLTGTLVLAPSYILLLFSPLVLTVGILSMALSPATVGFNLLLGIGLTLVGFGGILNAVWGLVTARCKNNGIAVSLSVLAALGCSLSLALAWEFRSQVFLARSIVQATTAPQLLTLAAATTILRADSSADTLRASASDMDLLAQALQDSFRDLAIICLTVGLLQLVLVCAGMLFLRSLVAMKQLLTPKGIQRVRAMAQTSKVLEKMLTEQGYRLQLEDAVDLLDRPTETTSRAIDARGQLLAAGARRIMAGPERATRLNQVLPARHVAKRTSQDPVEVMFASS
jgi:hypothetical protein